MFSTAHVEAKKTSEPEYWEKVPRGNDEPQSEVSANRSRDPAWREKIRIRQPEQGRRTWCGWVARVWNNYSIPRVWNSASLYSVFIYIYQLIMALDLTTMASQQTRPEV
jgi:hypothetical protein